MAWSSRCGWRTAPSRISSCSGPTASSPPRSASSRLCYTRCARMARRRFLIGTWRPASGSSTASFSRRCCSFRVASPSWTTGRRGSSASRNSGAGMSSSRRWTRRGSLSAGSASRLAPRSCCPTVPTCSACGALRIGNGTYSTPQLKTSRYVGNHPSTSFKEMGISWKYRHWVHITH
ncbi:RING/U-box superfamily protein [Zea mays]|uniref:RING/U-box superfamily protein n=1 Tax=Zea mays TaxID=4577 RepID=A0A1D6J054_MAIZE|nr:RING/U-box superfamily protein [Zea mays]AQK41480.1 RING/U-box superfamily protein [Zea mays]AQK41485.1 RING/U-box superfamily protein [Zea mays]AQK41486.1 RING/U-box superfamily protein [Zea mays]AQK41487.1 RING/U-box superfamily protein [Zea mays]